MTGVAAHYQNHVITLKLTEEEKQIGSIDILLDPYQIAQAYPDLPSAAMEHIVKKALRGTDKGHTELEVLDEILTIVNRRKQIIERSTV